MSPEVQQETATDGASPGGWTTRTFLVGLAAVLAARLLYLARYGWDIGWMNLGYLGHAREIALGRAQAAEEQPLAFYALVAARGLGASAREANELVYLAAHLLLAAGALGIARFLWPVASAGRRAALVATLAVVPLLASQSGRNNLGVILAAGLTASALALALAAAPSARWRPATVVALVLAALAASLASTGRYEALVTCGGAALLLALLGGRMPAVAGYRRAALALGVGAAGGLAAVVAVRHALAGGAAPDKTYAFYTFFDGLPILMYPHLPGTEYGRYKASVGYFGSFRENHGSLVHAMLHHPGYAVLRIVAKPVDLLAVLLWAYALTPVGVALAAFGLRGIQRQPRGAWSRGWLLAAFLPPLAMLFIPQQNPAYYVSIAVPLVLAVARGADRLGAWVGRSRAWALGAATALGALALIAGAGKLGVSNSRAINAAVPYLENRCRAGCLTNVLPQALRDQAWVVTDAGAPLPPPERRSEQVILGGVSPLRLAAYDFCGRVRRARASGFAGPVLYVDARVHSFTVFDFDFDPEVRYQGTVDRTRFVEERRFLSGPDEVIISHLPPDQPCRSTSAD